MSENPYSTPSATTPVGSQTLNEDALREKVKLPAILLLVGGVVNGLISVGASFFYAYIFFFMMANIEETMQPEEVAKMRESGLDIETLFVAYGWGAAVMGVLCLIATIVIVLGAVRMLQIKSWGLAMTAAILSVIPFFQFCCLIGIPIGVFAIIVLSDPAVRQQFSKNSS